MMRYLIDSNILFFYARDPAQLTIEVKDILKDYRNRIYVPSKCVEELIYLQQSGKIGVKQWKSAEAIVDFIIGEMGFGIKSAAEEHLRTLARRRRQRPIRSGYFRYFLMTPAVTGFPAQMTMKMGGGRGMSRLRALSGTVVPLIMSKKYGLDSV